MFIFVAKLEHLLYEISPPDDNTGNFSMSTLTGGEILILTVWVVSGTTLHHTIKRPIKTAGRQQ